MVKLLEKDLVIANRSGALDALRSDVGIVFRSRPRAMAITVEGSRTWVGHSALSDMLGRCTTGFLKIRTVWAVLAQEMKLPLAELREALTTEKYLARARADFSGGVRSGVNGTLTFLGTRRRHDGPFEYGNLDAIEEASFVISLTVS
jgi:hypothetical protein